jgi:biotin transport system substrate-specific component
VTYAPAAAQRLLPSRAWYREIGLVAGSVVALAVLAQLHVPRSPVPVTGQTLGVLLAGGLLGFNRGIATVAAYLAVGAMGLPVFAGGAAGPAVLAGPTGGYLIGFLGTAGTAGLLAEHRFMRGFPSALLSMLVSLVPTFAIGLAWLSYYVPSGFVLAAGFWPFLPGALIKAGVAALIVAPRSGQ